MALFVHTLGCKVNQYESESIKKELKDNNIDLQTEKDIIIVNSCTVTAESDRKTRQLINKLRREKTDALIVLTGCMPQAFPKEAALLPADIIIGNSSLRDISKAIINHINKKEKIIDIPKHDSNECFKESPINSFSERNRAYIKIEDGCNRGCTYCIIPKARGRVRSRELENIKKEALSLSKNGYKEIVLTGINLSSFSYGIDKAVEIVANIAGIERVRLGSLEPDLLDKNLLENLNSIKEFCPNFHLSLQAGCNKTLKNMNRLYTVEEYEELISNIREIFNNPSITTDIMVGFPGESEEDFLKTIEFVEKIEFSHIHIFPYSKRSGTAAALYKNQITKAEKHRRCILLEEAAKKSAFKFNSKMINTIVTVLTEKNNFGYSENYVKVNIIDDVKEGEIVKIKITGADENGVFGKIYK